MFSLLFKRFDNLPVIVVKGGECEPHMTAPNKTLARPPGSGEFTCCMRNHKMRNLDGTERGIPCDKLKIGQLTWTMLWKKLSFMLGNDQLVEYRMWLGLTPHFMQGLPDNDAALKASRSSGLGVHDAEDAAKDFLATYHFKTVKDEESRGGSGMTPLAHAAMVGNVAVATEFIKQGANVHCKLRKFNTTVGADAGMTVLHLAVAVAPARQVEMVTVLLRAGADANVPSKSGVTPLMAGVAFHHVPGVEALLKCAKDTLDLERGIKINNVTALGLAAYLGTPELCKVLIKAGANRAHIMDHGGTKLHDACQNVATTPAALKILWNNGELDINAVMRPKTVFWKLIDVYFQKGVALGFITESQFAIDMAHDEGSTALHKVSVSLCNIAQLRFQINLRTWVRCAQAAKNGLIDVTEWLLQHGAHKSLHIRNKMGATPLDVARIFGPHPAIEAKLGAAMLNHQFETQYAIRRGSLLRKQAAGAIEPEEKGDDETPMSPSNESRRAEPTQVETIENNESIGDGTTEGAVVTAKHFVRTATNQLAQVPATNTESFATVDAGSALAKLSSGIEARFDEQALRSDELSARFDEQAVRFDKQAARLDALQSENAEIIDKLDALLAAQQSPRH